MSGFKSFGNRTVSVNLAKGFTCIVGPNGNGKSNVIDGLCFALGRMSKKTMRAKRLTDLIFAGSKTAPPAKQAEVEIVFDNKTKEFPYENDEFRISRWIKSKGTSGYRINGKSSTRSQILNALAQAKIDPDGSNQFVLQGKIVELTHMNTNARREYIEDLIGLSKYDEMKDRTMKELEKAEKDLGQFEAIFKEVSVQLKKVEKEKNDALKWTDLNELIRLDNAKLIALKINALREEEQEVQDEIKSTRSIIEEMEEKITAQKQKIESETLKLKEIEGDLSIKEQAKQKLDESHTNLKTELSAQEATLIAVEQNLERTEQNISKLKAQQLTLEEGQTYDDLISETNQKIQDLQDQISILNEDIKTNKTSQKAKEAEIQEKNAAKANINEDISNLKQETKGLTTEIKILKKSIQKNTDKRSNLKSELDRLKKEEQSIEDALLEANNESSQINLEISRLKNEIQTQKSFQSDLDNNVKELEDTRNLQIDDKGKIQAAISSNSAEINLFEKNIDSLKEKKINLQAEFDRITGGEKVEKQLEILKDKENKQRNELKTLKDNLSTIQTEQQQSQSRLETFELHRRNFESQKMDIEKRFSAAQIENRNLEKEFKINKRELQENSLHVATMERDIKELSSIKKKNSEKIFKSKEKVNILIKDREQLQRRIDRKNEEHESTSNELQQIMDILTNVTQNVDRSAENIKSDIQNVSQVAIDESKNVFQDFIRDITDILSSFQEISDIEDDSSNQIRDQLSMATQTMEILIENANEPLAQMSERVQDTTDEALLQSTGNFDGFIRDFMDQFDSIRVALQAVAVADTSELYESLDELNNNIQFQNAEIAKTQNILTKAEIQLEQKEKEFTKLNREIEKLNTRIMELKTKISEFNEENTKRTTQIQTLDDSIQEAVTKASEIKKKGENFWKDSRNLQSKTDDIAAELEKTVTRLNALHDVKRLLDDIEDTKLEQERLKSDIEVKKQEILTLSSKQKDISDKILITDEKIDEVKTKRKEADEKRTQLQQLIDSQYEELKEVAGKIKDLENVQKLIDEIALLASENENSKLKIEENQSLKDEIEEKILECKEKLKQEDEEINLIREERTKLEETESNLRDQVKNYNSQKIEADKELDSRNRMKQRENEIDQLENEAEDIENTIIDYNERIEQINEDLIKIEEERSELIEEITDLQNKKSKSWNLQQNLRETLSDFNAEISKNNALFSNLETRNIVIEEKIDELFEKSKDYGALPIVTDDLTEVFLNKQIVSNSDAKKQLEPVNLKSIEEYDVIRERWDEIDMRRQTLQRERKAILDSIDRIELEKTRTFMKAFHEINRVFSNIFQKLSPGGSAKMILENPAHPFEEGIAIEARPRGKKISSLNILSGGEKTLVALSFIFAIQNFYPAPFYVMDEIDAALDGPNVYRTSTIIKEYAKESQFLVISHREENITNADRIYGVAMNNGITDIFTVDLEEEKHRDDFDTPIEMAEG